MIGDLFDSPWKILIVAVVLIVLFGSSKLPVAARSLGKSMRILKAEVKNLHEDDGEPGPVAPAIAQQPPAAQPVSAQQSPGAQQAQPMADDLKPQPAELGESAVGQAATQRPQHSG